MLIPFFSYAQGQDREHGLAGKNRAEGKSFESSKPDKAKSEKTQKEMGERNGQDRNPSAAAAPWVGRKVVQKAAEKAILKTQPQMVTNAQEQKHLQENKKNYNTQNKPKSNPAPKSDNNIDRQHGKRD